MFSLHFMLYCGNLDYFSDSVRGREAGVALPYLVLQMAWLYICMGPMQIDSSCAHTGSVLPFICQFRIDSSFSLYWLISPCTCTGLIIPLPYTNTVYPVRKLNQWRYCLALCDEIFDQFPLFDETLRSIELCKSGISKIQRNQPKLFKQCSL